MSDKIVQVVTAGRHVPVLELCMCDVEIQQYPLSGIYFVFAYCILSADDSHTCVWVREMSLVFS
jgi:hypothetical protein